MLHKALLLACIALAALLATSSKAQAWGGYHYGYTHVGPFGAYRFGGTLGYRGWGAYPYGLGGFGAGYGGVYRYGLGGFGAGYGGVYGYGLGGLGPGYLYGGFPYGGYGGYRAGYFRYW